MKYVFLTEDADGVSYFEDREFELTDASFAPPAAPMPLSAPVPTTQTVFLTLPVGWSGQKHPSPRRQIGFCLAGQFRVEAGDGEVRVFGAGEILWMNDTTGAGHSSSSVGDEDVRMAIAQLD